MAKGEKRKAEKVKRVRLMKRHRDAILAAFGRAVDERFNAAARECFTGLVTDAMRKVFSGDELRAFNAAPEELAARIGGNMRGRKNGAIATGGQPRREKENG